MPYPDKTTALTSYLAYARTQQLVGFPGSNLDNDLNALRQAVDALNGFVRGVTRSDGRLANQSVGVDQLAPDVLIGIAPPVPWQTATAYAVSALVFEGGALYICATGHTSGTFATDLASGRWIELLDFSALPPGTGTVTNAEVAASAGILQSKLALPVPSFDTAAALAATTVAGFVNAVWVAGGSAVGDGAAGIYKRAVSEPAHGAKLPSAGGAWWERASDYAVGALAAASTLAVGGVVAGVVNITGSAGVTVTSLGTVPAGYERTLVFDGAATLTHNATSLILPGAANIVTAAGDVARVVSLGSGNWRCLSYVRNSGAAAALSLVSGAVAARRVPWLNGASAAALLALAAFMPTFLEAADEAAARTAILATGNLLMAPTDVDISGTFTFDAACKSYIVEVWGGGGGGGGIVSGASGQAVVGAGGNGGAYAMGRYVRANATATVVIGAGGTGVSGAAGNAGGTTTFTEGAVSITAPGGSGGGAGLTGVTNFVHNAPGAITTASGANILNGHSPRASYGRGEVWGATVGVLSGEGGYHPAIGVGGPPVEFRSSSALVSTGNDGTGRASGGSGAGSVNSTAARAGGAGTGGRVRIWQFG